MRKLTLLLTAIGIFCLQGVFAQTSVTGTVTDADNGGTLPGVSVQVKGTSIGTVTDMDGKYNLQVPEDATALVFSFVGMEKQEVAFTGQTVINIDMKSSAEKLDEVVVTALGISREKKSIGYAAQEVGGDELTRTGNTDVFSGLNSKVAGLSIVSSAGTPGASSKILIRGASTFTGENQPLIVVDGVPINNETTTTVAGDYPYNQNLSGVNNSNRALDLNPDDIESVTVLKGPAASALYGVRAGNGAIIYTTKKGTATQGKTIKVTAGYQFQLNQVNKLPAQQNTYAQGFNGEYIPFEDGGGTSYSWGPKISDVDGLRSYDNADEFFENGIGHTWNVAATGGNENGTFRVSFSNSTQDGMVPNSGLDRTTFRINGESKIWDKFRVSGSANYSKTKGNMVQNGSNISGIMLSLMRTPPSFNLKGEGDNGYINPDGTQRQYFWLYDNTYWTAYENPFTSDVNRILGNVNAVYSPFEWVDISYRIGTDFYSDARKMIFAVGSMDPPEPYGQVEENIVNSREVNSDLLITFKRNITEKIFGNLILGNNLFHRESNNLYSRGRNLSTPNFYNLSNAADLYTSQRSEQERTAALFFNLSLDYDRIVFLDITGRNEWASTFGPAKDNFFYPSVTASFVFSELIPENNILSFGKFRAGYAEVGISPPPYMTRTYFSTPIITDGFTNGLSFPYNGYSGSGYSSLLGNTGLKPEKVKGFEIGLDMAFLDGRINLDVAYYNQKSEDLLIERPIAASTGFASYFSNSGEMVNQGIELVLSGDVIKTKDILWNLAFNFNKNNNEVTKLVEGVDEVSVESAFTSIGSYAIVDNPYGAFFGTKWLRDGSGNLVIDANGYPMIDPERGYLGNPFPEWQLGINNSFSYKGITLIAVLDIRQGGDVWGGTIARMNRQGISEASAENREGTYVVPGVLADADGNPTSTRNNIEISAFEYYTYYKGDFGATEEAVFDGSWVRLREVSLQYRINLGKYNKFIQYADLSVSGNNLWVDTDYPGVDPETSLTGAGSNIGGFDYFNNPGSRTWIFGIKMGF